METKHSDLLEGSTRDDADARGHHLYPDQEHPPGGVITAEAVQASRRQSYAAGGEGTAVVSIDTGTGDR